MLRKLIFWLHLSAGVCAGSIVLIMSVTGVLLTYQKQMQTWADLRGLDGSAPSVGARPVGTAQLVASARKQTPDDSHARKPISGRNPITLPAPRTARYERETAHTAKTHHGESR